jgi:hypothetical protein
VGSYPGVGKVEIDMNGAPDAAMQQESNASKAEIVVSFLRGQTMLC